MDKIIDIHEIRKKMRLKKDRDVNQERLQGFQNFLQCVWCSFKCAMCGIHTDYRLNKEDPSIEFPLCGTCKQEYMSYLEVADGKKSNIFWHNTEWFEMWSSWIEFRKSLKRFLDSPECKLIFP